jgi:hypothetical protein
VARRPAAGMQVVTDLSSGRLHILLGGTEYSCSSSLDCPGYARCYVEQAWAHLPAVCACQYGSTAYGYVGALCQQRSPETVGVLFFIVLALVIAAVSFTGALVLLHDLGRKGFGAMNSFAQTLLATFLSIVFLIVFLGLRAQFTWADSGMYFSERDPASGDWVVQRRYLYGETFVVAGFLGCGLFALLGVPIAWLQLAGRRTLLRGGSATSKKIMWYKIIFRTYTIGVVIGVVLSRVLESTAMRVGMAIPGVLWICVAYGYGYYYLHSKIRVLLEPSTSDALRLPIVDLDREVRHLFGILSLVSLMFMVLNILFLLYPDAAPSETDTCPSGLIYAATFPFLTIFMAVLVWFMLQAARRSHHRKSITRLSSPAKQHVAARPEDEHATYVEG